ncbi:SC6A3-like protein [Mya arenaria]|uniref:SC6A3-like protein n=1 Tax=Mya arenaria TaxID=6604 RepID=A0ABY7EFN8_MYAAR|nr:sodium-dependent dopamine transporter-like isoform X1 [Mya arenaria]XP_052811604.1 sodium-dependent dopamine transporter-like isoform X1 [Mya arenaria]WAR07900.1 SC6A3-like protein [Mya arenaria]
MNAAANKLELQRLNGVDRNAVEFGAGCESTDVKDDVALDIYVNDGSVIYSGDYAPGSNDFSSTRPKAVREKWSGRFEFLLSVVGYTVGLGNIWRFPYFVKRNGGGVALIPFLLFLVTCGGPLYYIEVCLGQFSGKSPFNVWDICPLFRGIGFVMVGLSLLVIWYFGSCFAWIIYFLIHSFHSSLAWASCGQPWNTELCIDVSTNFTEKKLQLSSNMSDTFNFTTSATEFWENNVLARSRGIDDLGSVQLHLLGCQALGWLIVFLCICKGVKSLGKVVYVTATLPYVLLTVLLIRGVTLDGAVDGIKHYIYPDFSKLLKGQLWIEAAVQCFYSLGPAWGGVITMASFNKFSHNAFRDTMIVCFADGFTGFFSGLVVFSVLGFFAKETDVSIDDLPFSGASLAFIAYPEALSRLPLPNLWAVLFFITLILVGVDSTFGTFEMVINTIVDYDFRRLHRYRIHITSLLTVLMIVGSIPLCTSGGYYIFMLTDWYIATFNIVFVALLETIIISWIYGANRFSQDIEMMTGNRPSLLVRIFWSLIIPMFISTILISSAINFDAPSFGKGGYQYPDYAVVLGNVLAFAPLISIFAVAAVLVAIKGTGTITRRIGQLTRPSKEWHPNDGKAGLIFRSKSYTYRKTLQDRIIYDVLGLRSNT